MFVAGMVSRTSTRMVSLERSVLLRAVAKDDAGIAHYTSEYRTTETETRASLRALAELEQGSKGRELIHKMNTALDESDPMFQEMLTEEKAGDVVPAMSTNLKKLSPKLLEVTDASVAMMGLERDDMAANTKSAHETLGQSRWIVIVLLIFGVAIGGYLALVIHTFSNVLRSTSGQLSDGSNQVSSAAGQVASSSQSLAGDTSEQAAMIEETSASAEEINSMAQRNTDSARSANALVVEAVKNQQQTSIAVDDCVLAMNQIGESSSKIAKTLQVIDKIAFQTNILALNAAVEAARAGEAGMGFAVVAEEVRNLAQRCAAASEEISVLIEQSLGNSDAGRAKMATLVDSGAKVTTVFTSLKVLVEEISLSSEEQGRGIEQIGRAIQKMEQGTQKSAANAEESAAAAEQLNAQSEQLLALSKELREMVPANRRKHPRTGRSNRAA
jgi:methyl-accepting chemotaxis protein/methyl-accepting chemotaxis protein-1 (serine sensor receptor)